MAGITGLRNTNDAISGERPENYREGILLNMPNGDTPLTALTAVMKQAPVDDPRIYWFEKEFPAQQFDLGADTPLITVGTPKPVTLVSSAENEQSTAQLQVGMLLMSEETFEIFRITAVNSATSFDMDYVAAASATSTAVVITTDNIHMTVVGSAFAEGAAAPQPSALLPTRRQNYTQIFRNSIAATRTAQRTKHRTGPVVAEMKREGLMLHANSMERAFFFGKATEILTGSAPIRTCDGLRSVLAAYTGTSRLKTASASVTLDEVDEWMYDIFQYGSDEKVGFCGNRFILTLNQAVRSAANSQYRIVVGESAYGMRINRLISPFGELVLKRHPLFNAMHSYIPSAAVVGTPGMDAGCAVLDMAAIRYRPLKGDDTRYIPDVQAPGIDGDQSEWLTEASLEINFANRHYWISGAIA